MVSNWSKTISLLASGVKIPEPMKKGHPPACSIDYAHNGQLMDIKTFKKGFKSAGNKQPRDPK